MKQLLLLTVALCMLGAIYAEIMPPGIQKTAVEIPQGVRMQVNRDVPEWVFTKPPTSLITNFYDYMIGSYSGLPMRVIPNSAGGGYFISYMGRRQSTGTRRVFYTYLDAQCNVNNNNEITNVQIHEGFSTIAVDPIDGKPLYAWHANGDTDTQLEVQFTSDAFISGIPGLFNEVINLFNNPYNAPPPYLSTDNTYIWPTAVIGPSPIAGKRRVYVVARNSVSHTAAPSENPFFAYADFNGIDIENGGDLNWSYMSIPELDAWNHDAVNWRRPFHAITADNMGNLFYAGYHFATDSENNSIIEEDMDVFMCSNYGQGTWTRVSAFAELPSWNPPEYPGGPGYFTDANDVPYPDSALTWGIANSSHLNAVIDTYGRIHVPALWALQTNESTYYPSMQFVKSFIYDPGTQQFTVREIYPQKHLQDNVNQYFTPWDYEEPWGVVDGYGGTAPNQYPLIITEWPFPHWDATAHTDAMMFHYNNIKLSEPNDYGMMVCVWQSSLRARWYNYYSDPDYSAYANAPEIYISVSPNNGGIWSEPIVLNRVDTPQLAGIKPMWVYPADKVIYTGMQGNQKVGKLGLLFYNDFTWGSFANQPPYHPINDGGETMIMELQIVFPFAQSNEDDGIPAISNMLLQNYPNPFNPETTISFDMPASGNANLSIYNVKGQLVRTLVNETRPFGRNSVVWNGKDKSGNAVSSGIYFYRLSANGRSERKKMMLMK
ncbi:MAG: FlgD immunoglobulin-like domain containing protein [Candidatus Cloacimonadaceae bacterium]|nr:FlgD immunoglobulin-like domain containing protein [Candidatus Cloacimonadaceae bacterium]MDP3114849.1 FlgD immunoglobulin-like domain containing protein [Candidatus Cloacimonadaceae bacterium]